MKPTDMTPIETAPAATSMTVDRFAALLDAYGADLERWPAGLGEAGRLLLVQDGQVAGQANRLAACAHAEAQALDRLLLLAPRPSAAVPALIEQIMAASASIGAIPRPAPAENRTQGNVVPLSRTEAVAPHQGARQRWWPDGQIAAGGGMLAASLLLGIWLGASGVLPNTVTPRQASLAAHHSGINEPESWREMVQTALPSALIEDIDEELL